MLSGNGRHRRPRQAPAFLVTAGVTGASVALPLLGAGAAQAVDGETWDRVAECESEGNWLSDGSNGYYGGLQLPLSLWAEFGGEEFADRPDLASRSQQIAVAERILAERGPRAFPACAISTGLLAEHRAAAAEAESDAGGGGSAEGRDGSAPTPEESAAAEKPSASAEKDRPGASGSGASQKPDNADKTDKADKAGKTDRAEKADESDPADGAEAPDAAGAAESADPAEAANGAKGSKDSKGSDREDRSGSPESARPGGGAAAEASGGKHRGQPDPEEAERSGQPGGGRHAAGQGQAGGAEGAGYEVASGDSLYAIADEQAVPGGWPALYELNADVVGEDPDHILPGQLLDLEIRGANG